MFLVSDDPAMHLVHQGIQHCLDTQVIFFIVRQRKGGKRLISGSQKQVTAIFCIVLHTIINSNTSRNLIGLCKKKKKDPPPPIKWKMAGVTH